MPERGRPEIKQRSFDRLVKNFGRALFLFAQTQKVRQKAHRIPANRGAPEQAEIGFLAASAEQYLQGLLERDVAKIGQSGTALRPGDQIFGARGPPEMAQSVKTLRRRAKQSRVSAMRRS